MDHLLPVLNDPEFFSWFNAHKTKTPVVDTWKSILCMQFAQKILKKKYSVYCDKQVPGGCDLLISENHHDIATPTTSKATWQIILKAATAGGESYDEIIRKLEDSVRDVMVHDAGWTYLIAAKGTSCMAWRYKSSDSSKVQLIHILNGSVYIETQDSHTWPLSKEYDISNPSDQRDIVTLLDYIRDNPIPGPTPGQ